MVPPRDASSIHAPRKNDSMNDEVRIFQGKFPVQFLFALVLHRRGDFCNASVPLSVSCAHPGANADAARFCHCEVGGRVRRSAADAHRSPPPHLSPLHLPWEETHRSSGRLSVRHRRGVPGMPSEMRRRRGAFVAGGDGSSRLDRPSSLHRSFAGPNGLKERNPNSRGPGMPGEAAAIAPACECTRGGPNLPVVPNAEAILLRATSPLPPVNRRLSALSQTIESRRPTLGSIEHLCWHSPAHGHFSDSFSTVGHTASPPATKPEFHSSKGNVGPPPRSPWSRTHPYQTVPTPSRCSRSGGNLRTTFETEGAPKEAAMETSAIHPADSDA
jgi:hypothetical protein